MKRITWKCNSESLASDCGRFTIHLVHLAPGHPGCWILKDLQTEKKYPRRSEKEAKTMARAILNSKH